MNIDISPAVDQQAHASGAPAPYPNGTAKNAQSQNLEIDPSSLRDSLLSANDRRYHEQGFRKNSFNSGGKSADVSDDECEPETPWRCDGKVFTGAEDIVDITDLDLWKEIRKEAHAEVAEEPMIASFLHATILNHKTLEGCLAFHLASKLGNSTLLPMQLYSVFNEVIRNDPEIRLAFRADLRAVKQRDPACRSYVEPLLYFKGFSAMQAYRIAHHLLVHGRRGLALVLQSRISEVFQVDIHPAATIGRGILMDHATGIVVGETAVIGNNCSILHDVTLGGTGKDEGDRHPKIGVCVMIGAGAKVLGNIKIGDRVKIGAGSVVLSDLPADVTVAGVPAKIIGRPLEKFPALSMNQHIRDTQPYIPDWQI